MTPLNRLLIGVLLLFPCSAAVLAQHGRVNAAEPVAAAPPSPSALNADLFYLLLLSELDAQAGQPGQAFERVLDAARKTQDAKLYRRAVELAFQARSGDQAMRAARAWKQAHPQSREANGYMLRTLLLQNRVAEALEPLKAEVALAEPGERAQAMTAIPRLFQRVGDKRAAAAVVEQALADYVGPVDTGPTAWTTIGRMRLAAGDIAGALEAARRGQQLDAGADGPALLALEMMDPRQPQAEPLVRRYLEGGKPAIGVRMGYARALLDAQRGPEALRQIELLTAEQPDFAEAWLVRGSLLMQEQQLPAAETAFKRYAELAEAQGGEERARGLAQAYLQLSQIAEKRGDIAQAASWLDKIDNGQELVAAQTRRASLLARQGRLDEARQLLRSLPERNPADARMKIMAEVNLLREHRKLREAYDLLVPEVARNPADLDLAYEQAMLAEKLGRLSEMELLLRGIIAAKPDYHHAYNALGYSLADRGERLTEARELIRQALRYAPGDPFITDSLGWVEFRLGNTAEAARVLESAYRTRPDPEIAAHLGEVLWTLGDRERAQRIWREGLMMGQDNETLLETLKRFKVQP